MSAVSAERVANRVASPVQAASSDANIRKRAPQLRPADSAVANVANARLEAAEGKEGELQPEAAKNEGQLLCQILSSKGNDVFRVSQSVRTEWQKTGHLHQSLALKGKITTAQIDQILKFFPNIRHLTLEEEAACQLAYFASRIKDAETLHLKSPLTDKQYMSLDADLLTFAENQPQLKTLRLTGCPYNTAMSCQLSSQGVYAAVAKLSHLTTLGIRATVWWRKEAMEGLVALNHQSITTLEIQDQEIGGFYPHDVEALVSCLSQLATLKTVYVTKALCGCRSQYDTFMKEITEARSDLKIIEHEASDNEKMWHKITWAIASLTALFYCCIVSRKG